VVPAATWFRALADTYNTGNLEAFLEGIHPEVVFQPDPEWPEPGPFVGRDSFARFLRDWRGAWEEARIEVDKVEERDDLAIAQCRWIVTGASSGAPVPVAFTFVVGFDREGLVTEMRAFFDHSAALGWVEDRAG
jgi:SnoaL-like domain